MKRLTFILLLAILLSACAPAVAPTVTPLPRPTAPPPTATVPPPQTPTADTAALRTEADAIFQNLTKAGAFSGAVLIAQNGRVILSQGYGFADRAKKIPNTPQTKFRVSHLAWAFTAMAILMLQEQGKLNVQDQICKYLTGCPDSWKTVTLHHLLTHSSGIPEAWSPASPQLDQVIADAKTKPLDFQPGEKLGGFSLTEYILLGRIIETVSGHAYETFMQQSIFEPLKMASTGYDHGQADLALGYTGSSDHAASLDDQHAMFPGGAPYSTVEDLYRWDQALYTDQLVPQKAVDAMFTAYVPIPESPGVLSGWSTGYGLIVRPSGPRISEQSGGTTGFTSVIHRFPDDRIVAIILTNQDSTSAWGVADQVTDKLFGMK